MNITPVRHGSSIIRIGIILNFAQIFSANLSNFFFRTSDKYRGFGRRAELGGQFSTFAADSNLYVAVANLSGLIAYFTPVVGDPVAASVVCAVRSRSLAAVDTNGSHG